MRTTTRTVSSIRGALADLWKNKAGEPRWFTVENGEFHEVFFDYCGVAIMIARGSNKKSALDMARSSSRRYMDKLHESNLADQVSMDDAMGEFITSELEDSEANDDSLTVSTMSAPCSIDGMGVFERGVMVSKTTFSAIHMDPGDSLTITKKFIAA